MTHTNLDQIAQRTYRYQYANRLSEITIRGFFLIGALALLFGTTVLDFDAPDDSISTLIYAAALVALVGLLFGYRLLFYGRKTGLARFYVEAGVTVVLAFVLPLTGIDSLYLTTAYLAIVGGLLLAVGGVAFQRYLAHAPAQDV